MEYTVCVSESTFLFDEAAIKKRLLNNENKDANKCEQPARTPRLRNYKFD